MIRWILEGTSRKLSGVPEGATVTEVNGREVAGHCEMCGGRLYEDTGYAEDCDGVKWHLESQRCRKDGRG